MAPQPIHGVGGVAELSYGMLYTTNKNSIFALRSALVATMRTASVRVVSATSTVCIGVPAGATLRASTTSATMRIVWSRVVTPSAAAIGISRIPTGGVTALRSSTTITLRTMFNRMVTSVVGM